MAHFVMIEAALPSIQYTDQTTGSGTTTHSFAGVDIGAASNRRTVVVAVIYIGATTSCTCSINGNSATNIAGASFDVSTSHSRMFYLPVSSGTTATIDITTGVATLVFVAVYAAYDIVNAAPIDSSSAGNTTDSTLDLSLDVSGRGVACAFAIVGFSDATWTGMTEAFDNAPGSGTGALYTATSAQSPLSVTVTSATTPATFIGSAVSFR